MLKTRGLTKEYGRQRRVTAVSAVDLEVAQGEFVAIVGRSGSGKSSLLAMIGGLTRPSAGTVEIGGVDQWALKPSGQAAFRNTQIGFVFQFPSLLPSLRAIDNVVLPALLAGRPQKEAYERACLLLGQVGLGEKSDSFANEISGGEQRRVAIARALMNSPKLVLADEPTADLDEETESEILDLLILMKAAYGFTLVVVTHNLEIAARADRTLRMSGGAIASVEYRESPHAQVNVAARSSLAAFPSPEAPRPRETAVALGAGFDRFVGRLVLAVVPFVAVLWLGNVAVTSIEQQLRSRREEARQALETLAMSDLRADVKQVTSAPDGTYDLAIYLRNTTGGKPIYVLAPSVRGFIQVGSSWEEVPMTAVGKTAAMLKVADETILHYRMQPKVSGFAHLIPFYMHARISNAMLIGATTEPKAELVDRSDDYYVYLKPHDADDKAILASLKFPGPPPVWIPMPPH